MGEGARELQSEFHADALKQFVLDGRDIVVLYLTWDKPRVYQV